MQLAIKSADRLTTGHVLFLVLVLAFCSGQTCGLPYLTNSGPPSGTDDDGSDSTGGGGDTDGIDLCPDDPAKTAPGICGCGNPETCHETETITIELAPGVSLELMKIPAGTFLMGSPEGVGGPFEQPQHEVTISKPFYLGKYEITQGQWKAMIHTTPPWTGQDYTLEQDNCPAEYLGWYDAQAFCEAVQTQTGYAIRLPSEAEWEYACRAGSTTVYYFGDDERVLSDYAWFDDAGDYWWWPGSGDDGTHHPHPVGEKIPNAFGLYDMHGNVEELVQDTWHKSYTGAPAYGSAWTEGNESERVVRSGSWGHDAYACTSAYRFGASTNVLAYGFRVALDSD